MISPRDYRALAKITVPKSQAWIARDRLFRKLDNDLSHKAIWISAPAGAGKTTLIASYLADRKLPAIWYQVDESDADPASFFYYLGLGAKKAAPRRRKQLPVLAPEYLHGLPTFNRNFFRELNVVLKKPSVFVLDNYQDVPAEAALHELLPAGISELADNVTVIIISRTDPPPTYARMRAQQALRIYDWNALRLSEEENKEICQLRLGKSFTNEEAHLFHENTRGWVTGLILLLEQSKDHTIPDAISDQGNQQVLFDYFAEEIFQRAEDEVQDFLLKTALLPKLTLAMAEQLTGSTHSNVILNDLTRRNFFTVTRPGKPPSYEYHPLFREFLLARLKQVYPADALKQLEQKAALIMAEDGHFDAAADIFLAQEDWESLIGLILSNAQSLVAGGSFQTLRNRLEALPAPLFEQAPWLSFWLGVGYQPIDLIKSRGYFQQAFEAFKGGGDSAGAYLAWAGAIDTFLYVWGDFHPLDYWIDQFLEIHQRWRDYPSPEIEGRATFGMFAALMWRRPEHPEFPVWRERVETMLYRNIDPSYRIMSGSYLLFYAIWWQGNLHKAGLLMALIRPLATAKGISPLAQLMWKYMESAYAAATNAYPDCIKAVEEGLQIAGESGVYIMNFTLHAKAVYGALGAGKPDVAGQHLEQMAALLNEAAFFDRAHYHHLCSWHALVQGDLPRAREQAQHGLKLGEVSGGSICCPFLSLTLAQVLLEQGDFEQADEYLRVAEDWGERVGNANITSHSLYTRAYLHLIKVKDDEARGLSLLREALVFAKSQGHTSHPWVIWRRDVMLQLFFKALEHNMEVDYVHGVIHQRHLMPAEPPLHLEKWPWPIKIRTLGRFSLLKDDEPMRFPGKGQNKPLELLKVLIAFGGRDVGKEQIMEALWPDADGDMANQNFDTTLHRLRKLLGQDVLQLQDGHLTLDSRHAWVDVWAFERQLSALEQELSTEPPDLAELQQGLHRLLRMYQGDFLHREPEAGWMLGLRERLKQRWLRISKRLVHALGHAGQCELAIDVYRKMIELDDLGEEFYRGLMGCYAAQGQQAEATAIYGRCQTLLKSVLGVTPAVETERLYTVIQQGDRRQLDKICATCHARNPQHLVSS